MIVSGRRVTFDQADEILIRTNDWNQDSTDHDWTDTVYAAAGIEMGTLNIPHPDAIAQFKKMYRVLDLQYCWNIRLMSRDLLGPRGWCDWDGTIRYELPLVGPTWPQFQELVEDWVLIASAFPFLECQVQFVNQEITNAVEKTGAFMPLPPKFRIKVDKGKVVPDISERGFKRIKHKYESRYDIRTMMRRTGSHLGQQGAPIARIKEALDRVSPL